MNCQVDPQNYAAQLATKVESVQQALGLTADIPLTIAASLPSGYRMRAEFRVWHLGDDWQYAMFDPVAKKPVFIEHCPMVTDAIAQLMQPLRQQLVANALLSHRLYAIDFLASSAGEVLVTLIYKIPLTDAWQTAASLLDLPSQVMVMGRSRGKKRVLVQDYVTEPLSLASGATIQLRHVENAFSQPNAGINQQMLNWVDAYWQQQGKQSALLELYGGSGNFTWVLAQHADAVVMTELSKQAIAAAEAAFAAAGVHNVVLAAMDSEQVSVALQTSAQANQLTWQGVDYQFSGVLVDPPRAGLDATTAQLVQGFEHVVYISCNLDTLARDVQLWQDTHRIVQAAVFDQFPYTQHVEVGVVLQLR